MTSRLVVVADGGSRGNPGPAGWGAVVRDPTSGRVLTERAGCLGIASNNVAEYTGLVAGLTAAREKPRAENADALANEAMTTRHPVLRDRRATGETDRTRQPMRSRRPSGASMRFDDEEPLTLVMLRHGETPMTTSKAYSGSGVPGPELTRRGRVQATQAADLVSRIGRTLWEDVPHPTELLASPMVRTRQTAGAVGRRLGLSVDVDAAFAECDFGEWEGRTAEEIEVRWPGQLKRWHVDAASRTPGGESIEDVGGRVQEGLRRLLAAGVDRTVVVVSHSVAIRAAIGSVLGAPTSVWASVRVGPASLSILRMWEDGEREVAVVGMPTDV